MEQDINKEKAKKDIEMLNYDGEDRVVTSDELYSELESQALPNSIYSKIPTMDVLIDGFNPGELTIVSGLTGQGKTLFLQTLTNSFYKQGLKSLWFSYEVTAKQFINQLGNNPPTFCLPRILASNKEKWIYARIYEAILKYDIKAVFVDHLHYLSDVLTKRNPSLEIGKVMRTIKQWALEFRVAIFLIAHALKIRFDDEPGAGDTRDSSFIEQEADNVFYIWRMIDDKSGEATNKAVLKITKNRRYGVMNKKIVLVKNGSFLYEEINDESESY